MGFFTKKTVIITGAGRAVLSDGKCGSIGYGIATAFAKEGANLVITGRNVQKLTDAKEELERLYKQMYTLVQIMQPLSSRLWNRQLLHSEQFMC